MEGSKTEAIIFTVLYSVTILISLVGNTFLIYMVWKRPDVRSLTSFMFVNMAAADLLVTLVTMPWSIAFYHTKAQWLITDAFGEFTCRVVIFVAYLSIMASILCLTFIAIDRFYSIVYPWNHDIWFRNPKILTPLIWVLSMALMSIILVTYHLDTSTSVCAYNFEIWGDEAAGVRGVFLYLFFVAYFIPLSIITILYVKIIRKLWFYVIAGHIPTGIQRRELRQRFANIKLVRALIFIVFVFAVCWLPTQVYHIFLAVTAWENDVPPFVMFLCYWFGHANSAINPWLYIALNREMTGYVISNLYKL